MSFTAGASDTMEAGTTAAIETTKQGCITQATAVDSGYDSPDEDQTALTIDHLIRMTAKGTGSNQPLIAYPDHATDYTAYTPKQLDDLVESAAAHYASSIPRRERSADPVLVVGMLGISDLSYFVSMLAISRLGHTALLLSTRITVEAYQSLITTTGASHLVHGADFHDTASELSTSIPTLTPVEIRDPRSMLKAKRAPITLNLGIETDHIAFIIHSSGSTGLPKPIYQTHKSAIYNYAQNFGLVGYCTLPLYHNHGISCVFRAIHARRKIYLYSAKSALASANLVTTLQQHNDIEIFYAVPYALKLLSESEQGVQLLTKLKIVMFGGSSCPKPIGDALVAKGVNLVSHYGATEVGQLMTSFRDHEVDSGWDWLRVPKPLKPYLSMEARGPGMFELCVKSGWRSMVATNRPDGSYATKDLFEPHPSMADAWRYYARLDDTIVLENGEKANPLLIEGVLRQNRHVAEAVVYGAGKPRLGASIIPASTSDLPAAEIIAELEPLVKQLNLSLPAYSHLTTDMISVLPRDSVYRQTDKGTAIRAAFYRDYAEHIESAYKEISSGTMTLERAELITFLQDKIKGFVTKPFDDNTDLFSLGIDSLQAIQVRSAIVKHIKLDVSRLGRNFVFDYPTITQMADELVRLQSGDANAVSMPSIEDRMAAMIERHSIFPRHQSVECNDEQKHIAITGATGSLGAHTVAQLARRADVSRIYCLVRAESHQNAAARVRQSLRQRLMYHALDNHARSKIIAVPSSLGNPDLGMSETDVLAITSKLTHVVHLAWSVNFNKTLESFEADCIAGVRNLINLCLQARRPKPAAFHFCSSVSATAATPGSEVKEALPSELSHAQCMGYAQSKLVAEHMCERASKTAGVNTQVLRVGQIIGDSVHGVWNATEAIPMILQTARTVGALPQLDERPCWLPVDTVAGAIIDIVESDAPSGVVNIVNHKSFHWTDDLLPMLRDAGLQFEAVPQREWVRRLRQSEQDPIKNPPIKLVDFFASKYDNDKPRRSLLHRTDRARQYSPTLKQAPLITSQSMKTMITSFERTQWKLEKQKKPLVIVFGGPCGSGKSTVASVISTEQALPLVEGDDLHSVAAKAKMASGIALDDEDRWTWLAHLRGAVMDRLLTTQANTVMVTCSALKAAYRDELRKLQDTADADVVFIMLATNAKVELKSRLISREGHYMGPVMVDMQVETFESPRLDEIDVLPVDAGQSLEDVLMEVRSTLQDLM